MGLPDLETIPETGAVFTVGRSRFADNVASHFFIRKDPVVSITCGDEHSAVICQSGRLFVFGSNDWGQLGLGHKNHIGKPSCVKALKPEKVTYVACGRAHTLICTDAQKIFACGSDQEGQLGRGTSAIGDSSSTPVLVYDSGTTGSEIVQIAAGSHHSLALTNSGGVLAWGSNLEGQLGLPDVSGLMNKPTMVHIPEPVKKISAGYYHSTFLTENGLVYVCGETESGKLGIDVNFSTQTAPKQMQLPCPAIDVACGGHHTVILAENGNLYCTGNNSNGQLGLGTNFAELHAPKLLPRGAIQNERVTRISCGESHTAIVTDSGKLYTCGDGRHGKLGLEENENNVHELTFVARYTELFVLDVACGGCHTILVGRRRETTSTQKDMDNSQMEHIQKRNSLPPLKLPVNRLQSETHDEKVNEIMKEQLNPGKDDTSRTNPQSTIETTSEESKDATNSVDNVLKDDKDSMNNIQKTVTTEENTEESTKDSAEDVPSTTTKETTTAEESQESIVQDETRKRTNDNEKLEMKRDTENNIEEKKNSESMNGEHNDNENNNETTENDTQNNEKTTEKMSNEDNNAKDKDTTDHTEAGSEDVKSEPMAEPTKSNNGEGLEGKTSPERQMSPTNSTPPPKPPRLKPGSGNSSTERPSSMEKENEDGNETKMENTAEKESERTEENESEKKDVSGSRKSSTKSGSSKSRRSKINMEEMIEIDKQTDKEKIAEEEKMNNDNTHDDADVVQSPPPRTGKMSKIFRSSRDKKAEAMENGTKATGITNHKPKSKTCTLL
ncbi:uncharacterized protein LOC143425501 [Xylocopa sonorina]|uniref:uncharacterized protein LOC143425501 n=1 Tax=Xylocopa sonorina TaxID=1818115 RepID=UPI00403B2F1D